MQICNVDSRQNQTSFKALKIHGTTNFLAPCLRRKFFEFAGSKQMIEFVAEIPGQDVYLAATKEGQPAVFIANATEGFLSRFRNFCSKHKVNLLKELGETWAPMDESSYKTCLHTAKEEVNSKASIIAAKAKINKFISKPNSIDQIITNEARGKICHELLNLGFSEKQIDSLQGMESDAEFLTSFAKLRLSHTLNTIRKESRSGRDIWKTIFKDFKTTDDILKPFGVETDYNHFKVPKEDYISQSTTNPNYCPTFIGPGYKLKGEVVIKPSVVGKWDVPRRDWDD